jgi:hypothetical protein
MIRNLTRLMMIAGMWAALFAIIFHVYATIHYRSVAERELENVKDTYGSYLKAAHSDYLRRTYPADIARLEKLEMAHVRAREIGQRIEKQIPQTHAQTLVDEWKSECAELESKISALEHKLDDAFVDAEMQRLFLRLVPVEALQHRQAEATDMLTQTHSLLSQQSGRLCRQDTREVCN